MFPLSVVKFIPLCPGLLPKGRKCAYSHVSPYFKSTHLTSSCHGLVELIDRLNVCRLGADQHVVDPVTPLIPLPRAQALPNMSPLPKGQSFPKRSSFLPFPPWWTWVCWN